MDFSDLSPELQEKARNCTTPEELLELAKNEGYELSDEDLEAVAGGRKWNCLSDCEFHTAPCNDHCSSVMF
ncbi:MAG: Nif11-like leader peptide family natural product precursor [Coriobacteriales bacterium]|jgi:predicted ribosomally synthesized peptide with nif11-like leader